MSALAEVPQQQELAAAPKEAQRSPRTAGLGPSSSECHGAQGCLWPQPPSFLPRNAPLGRGRAGWPFLEGRKRTGALSRLIGFRSERKRRCGPLQPMTFQKCYQRFHSHLAHSCNKVPPAPNATSVPAALGAVASLVTSNLPPIWVSPIVTKH